MTVMCGSNFRQTVCRHFPDCEAVLITFSEIGTMILSKYAESVSPFITNKTPKNCSVNSMILFGILFLFVRGSCPFWN